MDTNATEHLLKLKPGSVISIRYPFYKHFAIVSDRYTNGKPNLISLSHRTTGVQEEPWDLVVGNRPYEGSNIKGTDCTDVILKRARSYIGANIRYNLVTFNCEHFVRLAHGLAIQSKQVQQTLNGAIIGAVTCLFLPNVTITRFAILVSTSAITSLKSSLNEL